MEGVGECAGFGVAQRAGNPADIHVGAGEQLPRRVKASLVQKLAERRALRTQAAVERPRMHPQAVRHRLQREVAEQDTRVEHPHDLVGDVGKGDRPIFRDRFFQSRAHTEIGAGHRAFELARREDEGRLLDIETDGDAEETAIGSGVGWLPSGQEDFVRQSSAEFPHHVEADGGCAIAQMIGALGSRLVDRIADPSHALAGDKIDRRAADVATLIVDEVLQRAAKGRGVAHQSTDEPEASGVATLADQKPEVRASRSRRSLLKETTRRGEGDHILRIVEHVDVDPDACRHLGGIGAKLLQELRRLRQDPHTLLSLRHARTPPPARPERA